MNQKTDNNRINNTHVATAGNICYITPPLFAQKSECSRIKKCSKCGQTKSFNQFHKDSRTPDGLYYGCKTCHNQTQNQRRNTTQGKAKLKAYHQTTTFRENLKRYHQSPKGKQALLRANQNHRKKHPERARSRTRIDKKIQRGTLIRPNICEKCGQEKDEIQAHHSDYSKPLEVEWLCPICHRKEYKSA